MRLESSHFVLFSKILHGKGANLEHIAHLAGKLPFVVDNDDVRYAENESGDLVIEKWVSRIQRKQSFSVDEPNNFVVQLADVEIHPFGAPPRRSLELTPEEVVEEGALARRLSSDDRNNICLFVCEPFVEG